MPEYHHGVEVETVRALGARVRYFPIGADLSIDPGRIEALLSAETRFLYVIHYFGLPQPVAELRRLCSARGIQLFEDCALSLLSADGDTPLGSVGEAAAFCLYKTLPVPDGGLLVLNGQRPGPAISGNRIELTRVARESLIWMKSLVREPARGGSTAPNAEAPASATTREDRCKSGFPFFDPAQLELAMSPLTSVLLKGLDLAEVKRRRRRNYVFWTEAVADDLECLQPVIGRGVCPLLFPILVEDKEGLREALLKDGIEIHHWWHRWYGGAAPGECPRNDELRRHLVGLPVQQNLGLVELERIRLALRKHLPRHV
jgi:dTDP-4-amino-4,6-dideoxygalactose transaminase